MQQSHNLTSTSNDKKSFQTHVTRGCRNALVQLLEVTDHTSLQLALLLPVQCNAARCQLIGTLLWVCVCVCCVTVCVLVIVSYQYYLRLIINHVPNGPPPSIAGAYIPPSPSGIFHSPPSGSLPFSTKPTVFQSLIFACEAKGMSSENTERVLTEVSSNATLAASDSFQYLDRWVHVLCVMRQRKYVFQRPHFQLLV